MTILLAHCYRMPWLSDWACTCMGITAIAVAVVGTAWLTWWAGRG